MERKTTDFSGKWTMKSSENFEELLKVLGEYVSGIIYLIYLILWKITKKKKKFTFNMHIIVQVICMENHP